MLMPQFIESKKVAAAASPRVEPSFLVHPLTESHSEAEVLAFLAERPVQTVVMSGLVRDNGLESPFNRGTFYACRDASARLEGVALIEHGRVWVLVERGELLFKADVAAQTPECTYVEGVYVEPASRQQGHGLRCLSQLGRALLGRSATVCALVNEQNLMAQALFMKSGYKLRGYYETVFLERRAREKGGEV